MFRTKQFLPVLILLMIGTVQSIHAQQSFEMYGLPCLAPDAKYRMNSFEGNAMNTSSIKDWEFSLVYGSAFGDLSISGNIYLISLGKRIGKHYFYGRYTPAIKQSFVFNSGIRITDSSSAGYETELKERMDYEEKFGFGYSVTLTKNFSLGFSVRYFQQKYTRDILLPFFSDSINYIKSETEIIDKKFWRGDIGFSYIPFDHFSISASSINLINIKEDGESADDGQYDLRTEKGALIGLSIYDVSNFNFHVYYETTGDFNIGLNKKFEVGIGDITLGISALHDKYREAFISAVVPAMNFSTNLFSITLSGVKYLGEKNQTNLLTYFQEEGISNILNNRYSSDMVFLSFNIALSFQPEKLVDLLDVKIENDIYPVLIDEYVDKPFAVGRVINLADKQVKVQPSSFIEGINKEIIYSPEIIIAPFDTADVPFYTVLESGIKIERRQILPANFYVTTINSEPDDEIQKPVLINDNNSWDGRVKNLRYFVKHDFNFMSQFSKNILNDFKVNIDVVDPLLKIFEEVKILFGSFASQMSYVADPRSSVDRVQFPSETLDLKGGDCDDLAVCFSSMLESVGIQTAFVDYKSVDGISHVNLLVNTNMLPEQSSILTMNDKKYFIRKNVTGTDEIWIPVETTMLKTFEESWENASEKFYSTAIDNYGLAKGTVEIVDVY
ncbi:MAG: hypothetical protein V1720_06215 [bacterium]